MTNRKTASAVMKRPMESPVNTEVIPYNDMKSMARDIAASGLFGMKNETQVLALMAVAQAEGKHPAIVARDYDIIQGRPAKKAEAMLRDFLQGGGKVEWHQLNDEIADATFSHAAGGTVRISWDMARAQKAELKSKDMYKKYPRQMLRSRVVSEGVRAVGPFATSGLYVPEEVREFEPKETNGHAIEAVAREVAPPQGALSAPEDMPKDRIGEEAENIVSRGKHKGKPWAEVGTDYLEWCVGEHGKAPRELQRGAMRELELRASRASASQDYDEEMPASAFTGPEFEQ